VDLAPKTWLRELAPEPSPSVRAGAPEVGAFTFFTDDSGLPALCRVSRLPANCVAIWLLETEKLVPPDRWCRDIQQGWGPWQIHSKPRGSFARCALSKYDAICFCETIRWKALCLDKDVSRAAVRRGTQATSRTQGMHQAGINVLAARVAQSTSLAWSTTAVLGFTDDVDGVFHAPTCTIQLARNFADGSAMYQPLLSACRTLSCLDRGPGLV
jgi:hypothetical protein